MKATGTTINTAQDGVVRVQRDGPSIEQHSVRAAIDELTARQGALQAEIRAREGVSADRSSDMQLGRLRQEYDLVERQLGELRMTLAREGGREQVITVPPPEIIHTPGVLVDPRPVDYDRGPPEGAVQMGIALFICTAAVIILTPIMRALGRAMERRGAAPVGAAPETTAQLARLEQAIEAMAIEVERVSEGQRFATKLLAERDRTGDAR